MGLPARYNEKTYRSSLGRQSTGPAMMSLQLEGANVFAAASPPLVPPSLQTKAVKHGTSSNSPSIYHRTSSASTCSTSGTTNHSGVCISTISHLSPQSQPPASCGSKSSWQRLNTAGSSGQVLAALAPDLWSQTYAEAYQDTESTQARQAAKRVAVGLIPSARRVTWDGPRRLMFTPPASIALDNRPRRSSWTQSEHAPGRHSQAEATDLRLPPLTPLPCEEPAAVTDQATYAAVDSSTAAADVQQPSAPEAVTSNHAQQFMTAMNDCSLAHSPAIAAVSLAKQQQGIIGAPCTPMSAPSTTLAVSARTPPQLSENISRSRRQQQLSSNSQADAGSAQTCSPGAKQMSPAASGQASAANADCSGPPITRMRPPPVSTVPPAARKAAAKAQGSTGGAAADDALLDAVLCGWEEEGNDGELYPLTSALERTGSQGADLQDLQAAAQVLKASSANLAAPRNSPVQPRSRPSKARPYRRWQHE